MSDLYADAAALLEDGRLEAGQRVMLLAIETSKWKYSGMVFDWTAAAPTAGPAGTAVVEV